MINPAASLYDDITVVDRALEPFGAPQVNEFAGLRWMQRTLEQRRDHIVRKIGEVEQSTLTVQVRTATGSTAVRAVTVAALLEALQEQLRVAAGELAWPDDLPSQRRDRALLLELDAVINDDDRWSMVVQRPAGPLPAQPLTDDGDRLAFDAALDAMLDRFVDGDSGDVGAIVASEGLTLEMIAAPATGEGRTVMLDQHTTPAARVVDGEGNT